MIVCYIICVYILDCVALPLAIAVLPMMTIRVGMCHTHKFTACITT